MMKLLSVARNCCNPTANTEKILTHSLFRRYFQPDFVPRDPKAKPKRYIYPEVYNPYGPRPPPSEKIVQLADRMAALSPEELAQIGPGLHEKLQTPEMEYISATSVDTTSSQTSAAKAEEKKEKTAFNVKLEKFDAAAKIKVIKEVRAFTNLGLKEAKELVEKAPVMLKEGLPKEAAANILEKIKAAGGVAIME